MTKILFVCHGNICRSIMAECIMKKLVNDANLQNDFLIDSAATSSEEIGNSIHHKAKAKLQEMQIPVIPHKARKITKEDYKNYDILIGMDVENLYYMENAWNKDPENKVKLLLTYTGRDKDIADPWYTHNFDQTFNDLMEGCTALLEKLR